MKYILEKRLDIGRQIYDGELTKQEASEQYGISVDCAREYMRLYRDANHLPPRNTKRSGKAAGISRYTQPHDLEELEDMTKEELIRELVMARITEARLKKGYEVKGDGTVILYDSRNIR